MMIGHYLSMAFVKLRRTPFTTLANIVTLALGLACFIAAWGIATWWQSADLHHANASRTYVIGQAFTPPGQPENSMGARSTATAGKYMRQDFPEVEELARVYAEQQVPAAAGGNKLLLDMAFAEPGFLRIFDFDYIAGTREALATPGSLVLTEDAAMRLFGTTSALGKTVWIDNQREATVTAVIKAVRQPSFMGAGPDFEVRFDMLGDWASSAAGPEYDAEDFWVGTHGNAFVLLREGASSAAVNARMADFVQRRVPADTMRLVKFRFELFPVSEISTRNIDRTLMAGSGLGLTTVSVLLGLGVLTLVVACVNYASLATAQAASRTKEFGMRRVMGAAHGAVMLQAWLEAMLSAGFALVVALGMLALASPVIKAATNIEVLFFLGLGVQSWLLVGGIVLGVALLAGTYPALVLSRVRPADALRSGKSRSGPGLVARILVGVQFASASFLLILVTVAQQQRLHLEQTGLALHADKIVVLNDIRPLGITIETLENELRSISGVKSVTVSDRMPWTSDASVIGLGRTPDAAAFTPNGYLKQVGHDYFQTLDLPLVAGRLFDRSRETRAYQLIGDNGPDPMPVVIDRTYASAMGFAAPEEAIGKVAWLPERLTNMFGRPRQAVRIIGVSETDRMRMGASMVSGHIYIFAPGTTIGDGQLPSVKIAAGDVSRTLTAIRAAWDRLSPDVPMNARFLDALFEQSYRQHARANQVFIGLALAAFLIASVGLLGIAVHVAVRRRHEVAVRKTLGSSAARVVSLLLTDFSKPVIAGNVLAWPVAWLAANAYLSAFGNRIDLTIAPFLISMVLTLLIAWGAVIGVVVRAATLRPADVLRRA